MTTIIYDIAIIGGGLNGLAQAIALSHMFSDNSLQIALIDQGTVELDHNKEFDGRAFALSSSSKNMLNNLGIWDEIEPTCQPMTYIKVSDSKLGSDKRPILLHFDHDMSTHGSMSYMVEHKILQNALVKKVIQDDSIHIFSGQTTQLGDITGPICDIQLKGSQKSIKTRLIIAADGKHSPSREHAGIKRTGWSYGQTGIVTTVRHEKPHNGIAEEHFLPGGPFAILPLKGNRASLVWTEESKRAEKVLAMDPKDFTLEISKRFGKHLGEINVLGGRWGFPLALYLAEEYYKGRLVLVGDSAHLVHPIAGLGLNLGLRDIAALTDVIKEAILLGLDFGSGDVLQKYQKWRRFDNVANGLASDGLNRLFSNDHEAIRQIRDVGLKAVNQIEPLKQIFMQEASGLTGNVPSLMQR